MEDHLLMSEDFVTSFIVYSILIFTTASTLVSCFYLVENFQFKNHSVVLDSNIYYKFITVIQAHFFIELQLFCNVVMKIKYLPHCSLLLWLDREEFYSNGKFSVLINNEIEKRNKMSLGSVYKKLKRVATKKERR